MNAEAKISFKPINPKMMTDFEDIMNLYKHKDFDVDLALNYLIMFFLGGHGIKSYQNNVFSSGLGNFFVSLCATTLREQQYDIDGVKTDRPGYVYFVTDGELIKIGFTRDVPQRMATLQTQIKKKIKVIKVVEGTRRNEYGLHAIFKEYKEHGEWYRCEGGLQGYLEGEGVI